MKNGLYKVEFQTQRGAGAGVVTLMDGKLGGGDSGIYYVGEYSVSGDDVTAKVRTGRHTQGLDSVFGADRLNITMKGKVSGDGATFTATAVEAPGVTMQGRLSKIG